MNETHLDIEPQETFRGIKDSPYSFFLDSSLVDGKLGRWSFMGSDPFLVFKSKGGDITLEWKDGRLETFKANPFDALKDIFRRFKRPRSHKEVPFLSGGVGYFSYDLKDFIEVLPDSARDDLGLPDCIMGFYNSVKAFDLSTSLKVNPEQVLTRRGIDNSKRPSDGSARRPYPAAATGGAPDIRSNFTKESYAAAIRRAKDYIKKGDIYQVNLSQRFEADFAGDPFELYLNLRELNPAPFSSYLDFGDVVVLSSSPERFLKVDGRYIETRPIKGTRPRGRDATEDLNFSEELLASPKDRAEHVMIVDLERNDLGKVCEYGTVRPTEFVILEKYSKVFHLVSTVSGRLRSGVTPIDCLEATFPGGSITGAPKIRSMEIIEELEPVKRSIYTGAIGYIDFSGGMDTSIVIRTFILKGGKMYFQVGGGIVADSDPDAEYEETLHKASALKESLLAARGCYCDESLAQR